MGTSADDKRSRLAELLAQRARVTKTAPLSSVQERLWFLEQWNSGAAINSMAVRVHLAGELDARALEGSLRAVSQRHETLRTTFETRGEAAVQVIAPTTSLHLGVIDLTTAFGNEREAAADEQIAREARRPFESTGEPLLRANLFVLGAREHVLLLTVHHMLSDAWSMGILVRELGALYGAAVRGQTVDLPALPLQYADYAAWERDRLETDALASQLAYWRTQLDPNAVLALPTDRPRSATPSARGARHTVVVPVALTESLKAASRKNETTLFVTLLAAWGALLHRYTGQTDVVVGTLVAGRHRREVEGLFGPFINMLALRADLSGAPRFDELVRRVHAAAMAGFANQEIPFEKVVQALKPERQTVHLPLFQVLFVLQNAPLPALDLPGLRFDAQPVNVEMTPFDLTLIATEIEGGLRLTLEYRIDLFDAESIAGMSRALVSLLQDACARPSARIADLELMTRDDRARMVSLGRARRVYPPGPAVHTRVGEHARARGSAPALTYEGVSLTYAELDERSNRIANELRRRGVGPEVRVALHIERSLELVVAIVGILKSGGCYVPLDPVYPPDRLRYMLEDSAPRVLVTQSSLRAALVGASGELADARLSVLEIDAGADVWTHASADAPPDETTPSNVAYIIYTSGSTGQPKGVCVTHENVARLFAATDDEYRFGPDDVWTLFHSYAFDVSVWEIWGTLVYGGRLVVVPHWTTRNAEAFHDLVQRERATVLCQTPSAFAPFLQADALRGGELALRYVVFAGEALDPGTLRGWYARRGEAVRLVNMYGITETTVHVTYRALTAADCDGASVIGGPMRDLDIFVLDAAMRPTPPGVAGEIYVGGPGVARGYAERPALTAERFVPNPFGVIAGELDGSGRAPIAREERLYKSGDGARWKHDGELEYIGRLDQQVKIRGFRIELGEIESVLAHHAAIREAAVIAREDAPGEKRIVAYLVAIAGPSDGARPTTNELRAHLGEKLPAYMIPAVFVWLDAMPLTRNGKLDRRALPVPAAPAGDAAAFVAPRDALEEKVASAWAEVLRVDKVGVHDDFFALGGHSLTATQVVSRLRTRLGIDLPIRSFFESPTVAGMSAKITARAAAKAPPAIAVGAPRTAAPDGAIALSFAQQRLWFLDELEPGDAAYHIIGAFRLDGRLDVDALARSLNEIARRHESLRTTFADVDGQGYQIISPEASWPMEIDDLRAEPGAEQEPSVRRIAEEAVAQPFTLSVGPLVRARLARLADDAHVLIVVMHHIVSDGWSLGVVMHEIGALYDAFIAGRPSPLPELPLQYPAFARWQRAWLSGAILDQQLGYWRDQLDGLTPLSLPTDRPRPSVQTRRGAACSVAIARDLSDALARASRAEGVTLFMTLLAAFQTLLGRYANQTDVAVGSPLANRTRSELEGMIGFFVNTLVFRTDLSADPSFRELLARVRETTLGAYAHQDVPFEKLVVELSPERDRSRSPLFQVMFVLQNAPMKELLPSGLTLRPLAFESSTAKFDLTLSLRETPDGIRGHLEYDRDLFDRATIVRMIAHFEVLLGAAVKDPGRRISELPLLASDARQRLLVAWNDTAVDYPRHATIHELFDAQVDATPDATAITFGDDVVSYRDLKARADRLARSLRARGVGPEAMVGVSLDRSPAVVVALLAVLMAGGAYVPLDPSLPPARLAFMLDDTKLRVVVTDRAHAVRFEGSAALDIVLVLGDEDAAKDETEDESERAHEAAPSLAARPDSLAYVIYTSGSTGTPKGVSVTHQAVVRLARAVHYVRITPNDAVLHFAPIAFDASTFEIWSALLHGARIVVAPPGPLSLEELGDTIRRRGVTTAWLTASLFHRMVDERIDDLRGLRHLLAGGEVLSPAHVAKALRELPDCQLINGYGPTENTTFTCCADARRWSGMGSVPIGRPIDNTRVYVLDARLEPSPIGVPGELYAAGDGVARGYLNRPELTAERFVPDPFARGTRGTREEGRRMYRTGDLARYLASGEIEFIGRADGQIKLRGFRIELGEVESVVGRRLAAAGARDVVVVLREDAPGDKRLVAYAAPKPAEAPDAAKLRADLATKLPDYMIPSAFVWLDAMPITRNGKLDRRALPVPEVTRGSAETYVAPRTATESLVAAAWTEVIGVDAIGVNDDFFALGGHSLRATQVISRVRTRTGVNLPLRAFFESPTIAGLAARIDQAGDADRKPEELPAVTAYKRRAASGGGASTPDEETPLSFAQQRLWFLDMLDPGDSSYHVPAALLLQGRLDTGALARSLVEVARRHESLRAAFVEVAGRAIQIISPEASWPMPILDLSSMAKDAQEIEVRRLAQEEANRPFQLAVGPPVRARLLKLAPRRHVLLLVLHHIVSDGWSVGVMVRELGILYEAFMENRPSPLPAPELHYSDFARWQRAWLSGDVLEEQLAYWRTKLKGVAPLALPTDRPRPPVQARHGGAREVWFHRDLADKAIQLSRREGVTLFMTLLAAFQVVLGRYAKQSDVAVGSPVANRTRAELEGMIGLFTNTLVLRTDLSGDPTFRELLARVREVTLGAYANQDIPFEKLVVELSPVRDRSRSPLFQVMFVLQNAPRQDLALPDLTLEFLMVESTTAKFDLTFSLREAENGITGALEYDRELFDRGTIERMTAHFEVLLAAAVADPDRRISALPLVTPEERESLVVTWNDTRSDYPRNACVHEVFEAQVIASPDAVAVLFGDDALTYRELDVRANRLANYLRALGVGPESIVGISIPRSFDLAVGLLGILKAGGVYVPFDPELPASRLAFMIEDTRLRVIVADAASAEGLAALAGGVTLVRVDADAEAIARADGGSPRAGARAHGASARAGNLAYVLYTSGSTGRPKGVGVDHRAVVRLARATRYLQITRDDVVLQFAPVAFDLSTFEFWTGLLHGARIAVAPPGPITLEELGRSIVRHGVTTAWLTAALFHRMVEEQLDSLRGVRRLLAGGDVLSPWHVGRVLDEIPECRMINGYGPTENTTFTTSADLRTWNRAGSVPIGRPIDNSTVYLLDDQLELVPIGVQGDLYTGGDGVAREYLNRADLTAERFVPDPFAKAPGARMYRTGDLARYLPNGDLEFLGRGDHQIKLRGFRIELGEIQSALLEHASVRDGTVVARDDGAGGDKRLVAYVVGAEGGAIDAGELRAHLRTTLPEYMVPSAFVVLDALPMTPTGKVDRGALPAPDGASLAAGAAFVAPRTPTEEILTAMWREVLGVDRVGVMDSFFELGGHSLLATRLMARVRSTFGVELPLRTLFDHPAVAAFAEVLTGRRALLPPLAPLVPSDPTVFHGATNTGPVSLSQGRLLFNERSDPHRPAAIRNVPAGARISGPLDPALLERALDRVLERHEVFRTTFVEEDGKFRFVVGEHVHLALERVDLSHLAPADAEAELARRVREDAALPFDLAKLPLFRAWLYVLGPADSMVLLSTHHIVWDGYSEAILLRDLGLMYRALSRGEQPALPALPIQHSDYARWQDEQLRGPYGQALEAYWREHLAGDVPILDFPIDHPRPPIRSYRGHRASRSLGLELSAAVRQLARAEGATLYMTLVAAYQSLLSLRTGERDVTVFTNVAGRDHLEVENLVGCFTNVVLIRTRLDADPSFRELLARTRDVVLGAFTHQAFPYQRVMDLVTPAPNYARAINYAGFNLQNVDSPPMQMDELTFTRPPVGVGSVVVANMFFIATEEAGGVIHVSAQANADLYETETLERLLAEYERVLAIASADPSRTLSHLLDDTGEPAPASVTAAAPSGPSVSPS